MNFGGFRDILCCRYGIFYVRVKRCDSEHTFYIKGLEICKLGAVWAGIYNTDIIIAHDRL